MLKQKHLSDKIIKCNFFDLIFLCQKIAQDNWVLITKHMLTVDQEIV